MNIAEVVKLSANGYKVSEINELKGIAKDNPDALQLALNGNSFSDVKELLTLADSEDGTKPEEPKPDAGKRDSEPDYKSMYEELKKKSDDMESTIKKIQEDNARKPGTPPPSEEEALAEIVKGFM